MALAEVRQREVAKKLFPFRQQVLRRIFTERRRTAWKRNRASRLNAHLRVKRSRNASRRLTKNIFLRPRASDDLRRSCRTLERGTGDRPDHVHTGATRPEFARQRWRAALVTNLFTFVPTAANVQYYLEIVRDKYILRQIISAATESVRRAYEKSRTRSKACWTK